VHRGQIVIVTDVVDIHADRVIKLLVEMGELPIRINSRDVPLNASLSVGLDGNRWTGTLRISGSCRMVDVADIRSVWWRRPGAFGLADELTAWEREFAQDEVRHATRGLWSAIDCHWVSRPELIERASYKIEQLSRAAGLGFDVPRTVVTNDPERVRQFLEECPGGVVYKVLTDPYLALGPYLQREPQARVRPLMVMSTLVNGDATTVLDTVRTVPCQFQQLVHGRGELRVTVIDDELFCAEIVPPDHARPDHITPDHITPDHVTPDWRRHGLDFGMRAADLPDEVAARCLALVRSYGLAFGAIDLIVTPDDRYVFLEINPNGQFLFVQERVPAFRLDQAMAASLMRGRGAAA
jgi:hypothetical protein